MEVFLQLRLQVPFDHGLGDTVRNSGNSQLPLPAPALVDLHSLHGRWKVAAGRHPIPELVEIVFQIPVKLLDRLIVHTGSSPVRLYPFIRFPNPSFGNTPRLCFIQKAPPVSSWPSRKAERCRAFAPTPLQG